MSHSCQMIDDNPTDKNMTERIQWTAGISAPKNYLMEVMEGQFLYNEEPIFIPKGDVNIGWGKSGRVHVVGSLDKPFPDQLDITWFSFLEDKFYSGVFPLPREEIKKLFHQELETFLGNNKAHYSQLIVGLAPGGLVVVWINAGGHQQIVGVYHAEQIDLTMKELNPQGIQDRQEYINISLGDSGISSEIMDSIKTNGVELNRWKTYLHEYSWMPVIHLEGGGQIQHYSMQLYNGERETKVPVVYDLPELPLDRAVIKQFGIKWKDLKGNYFGAKLYFDESEIMDAFQKLNDGSTIEMRVSIDEYNSHINIVLKNEKNQVSLAKVRKKIYETSE